MEILASSDLPTPPPDRATLRRFRHVVADLGNDLYVATIDERLVGIVHTTYARQIATYPLARIELLAVAPHARRQGVGTSLVRHIEGRARERACARLSCDLSGARRPVPPEGAAFFSALAWASTGPVFSTPLDPPPAPTA